MQEKFGFRIQIQIQVYRIIIVLVHIWIQILLFADHRIGIKNRQQPRIEKRDVLRVYIAWIILPFEGQQRLNHIAILRDCILNRSILKLVDLSILIKATFLVLDPKLEVNLRLSSRCWIRINPSLIQPGSSWYWRQICTQTCADIHA